MDRVEMYREMHQRGMLVDTEKVERHYRRCACCGAGPSSRLRIFRVPSPGVWDNLRRLCERCVRAVVQPN